MTTTAMFETAILKMMKMNAFPPVIVNVNAIAVTTVIGIETVSTGTRVDMPMKEIVDTVAKTTTTTAAVVTDHRIEIVLAIPDAVTPAGAFLF